jgi:uridine kinase
MDCNGFSQKETEPITNQPTKPIIVGISGGSAAGKTTFAAALTAALSPHMPVVLNQDRYFRDWEDLPAAEREAVRTSNHPRAVCWSKLVSQVERLLVRQTIEEPVAGTAAKCRGDESLHISAADIVLIEGHLIFGHQPLCTLMDLKIYLDVDTHERVLRRMLRDTKNGTDLETVVAWYRRDVTPNFPQHTEPTRRHADLVIPYDQHNETSLKVVAAGIESILAERRV